MTSHLAAEAVNELGLELHRGLPGPGNRLLSPLSIQLAAAMAFAGSAGATREEMNRVLHFCGDETLAAFDALVAELRLGLASDDLLSLANRLFVQRGYDLRPSFLALVATHHGSAPEEVDYRATEPARARINGWVEEETANKIRDLVPHGVLDETTRLVLVNALYLRAAWQERFHTAGTSLEEFFVEGAQPARVPTMHQKVHCGYAKKGEHHIIALPFAGGAMRFVAFVPNEKDGLAALEASLDGRALSRAARIPIMEAIVWLPKFRIEPPALALAKALRELGLKSAFDDPRGSADFDAMAPRRPDDYLFLSEVLHKTFLALDEEGVEACLFVGRVADPR